MCLCSNLETKNYLLQLNVRNIFYNGNIKLISKINNKNTRNPNDELLKRKNFWLAASTHKEEEVFCLKTHFLIKKRLGNILTIIAPRHISRSRNIEALCKKFDLNVQVINKDDVIYILVGQKGLDSDDRNYNYGGRSKTNSGGGGGGTFVVK